MCAGKGSTTGNPSSPAGSIFRGVASLRSVARLLLAQIGVSDLQKAQARSFGHAKRRARIAAAVEENKPPPAVKRSIGLNSRMIAGGKPGCEGGNDVSGGGTDTLGDNGIVDSKIFGMDAMPGAIGQPEEAEVEPGNTNRFLKRDRPKTGKQTGPSHSDSSCSNTCLACCRVVLGHPLDTISYRCGGCLTVRKNQGDQYLAAEAAEVTRTARTDAFQVAPVAGTDERYAVKHAGPKSAVEVGSNGAGSGGGRRRKRNVGVGAAAVSQVSFRQQFNVSGRAAGRASDNSRLSPDELMKFVCGFRWRPCWDGNRLGNSERHRVPTFVLRNLAV